MEYTSYEIESGWRLWPCVVNAELKCANILWELFLFYEGAWLISRRKYLSINISISNVLWKVFIAYVQFVAGGIHDMVYLIWFLPTDPARDRTWRQVPYSLGHRTTEKKKHILELLPGIFSIMSGWICDSVQKLRDFIVSSRVHPIIHIDNV